MLEAAHVTTFTENATSSFLESIFASDFENIGKHKIEKKELLVSTFVRSRPSLYASVRSYKL